MRIVFVKRTGQITGVLHAGAALAKYRALKRRGLIASEGFEDCGRVYVVHHRGPY